MLCHWYAVNTAEKCLSVFLFLICNSLSGLASHGYAFDQLMTLGFSEQCCMHFLDVILN
jgi:hypothetical protein